MILLGPLQTPHRCNHGQAVSRRLESILANQNSFTIHDTRVGIIKVSERASGPVVSYLESQMIDLDLKGTTNSLSTAVYTHMSPHLQNRGFNFINRKY